MFEILEHLPYIFFTITSRDMRLISPSMSFIAEDNKILEYKIENIFLTNHSNVCFGCSKEPSHRDGSFEHPQHMFWFIYFNKIIMLLLLYGFISLK